MAGFANTPEDIGSVELVADWDTIVERLHNLENDDLFDTHTCHSRNEWSYSVTIRSTTIIDAVADAIQYLQLAANSRLEIYCTHAWSSSESPELWHVTIEGPLDGVAEFVQRCCSRRTM